MHNKPILDGITSDPATMGWMHGFPPPADKRIEAGKGNHMRFPHTRWSFSNMREFCPTVRVSRGDDWIFGVSARAASGAESPVSAAVPGGGFGPLR